MKKPGKKKIRRSRPQRSKKAGHRRSPGGGSSGRAEPRIQMMTMSYAGQEDHGDHDDCPYCVAMRELDLDPNGSMTMQEYEAYKARAEQLIEEQGMPRGETESWEDISRWFEWVNARMAAEGRKTDIQTMSDAELPEFMRRLNELSDEYELLN